MVGWASETTLDVEYAHTIAPGAAKILLVERQEGSAGTISMPQDRRGRGVRGPRPPARRDQPELRGHGTGHGSAAIQSLRGAYLDAYSGHITVLAGSGDSGVTGFKSNQRITTPIR